MTKHAPNKVTIRQIEEALRAECGVVNRAAARLGVHRDTIYKRLRTSERLRAALEETRQRMVDVAEEVLYDRLKGGDWEAARFVLDRLGGARGWSARVDIHHRQDQPWRIEVIVVDPHADADK